MIGGALTDMEEKRMPSCVYDMYLPKCPALGVHIHKGASVFILFSDVLLKLYQCVFPAFQAKLAPEKNRLLFPLL